MKVVKNKLAPPFKTVQFELEFGKGISRESEIIELGLKYKIIRRNGAYYSYDGHKSCGKDAFKAFLAQNHDVRVELEMKLREKLGEADTDKDQEADEATDGEPSQEIMSPDSTDEEAIAAVEA